MQNHNFVIGAADMMQNSMVTSMNNGAPSSKPGQIPNGSTGTTNSNSRDTVMSGGLGPSGSGPKFSAFPVGENSNLKPKLPSLEISFSFCPARFGAGGVQFAPAFIF